MSRRTKQDLIRAKQRRIQQALHRNSGRVSQENDTTTVKKTTVSDNQESMRDSFLHVFGFDLFAVRHDLIKTVLITVVVLSVLAAIYWFNL